MTLETSQAAATADGTQDGAFRLSSPDIPDHGTVAERFVFDSFGCSGGNVSPALVWSGVPEGTRSFAVMVHDPDAPTGGAGFWHWIVLDIPASAEGLPQGAGAAGGAALPAGARMIENDYGTTGWGGPCPPAGDPPHRYDFTLYALPTERLEVPESASKAVIGFMINASAIGKATFQAMFGR